MILIDDTTYTEKELLSLLESGTIVSRKCLKISNNNIKKIPNWISKISVLGDFECSYNQLKSLEGCPSSVSGGFSCHHNQLTNLEGCPSSVGGDFDCSNNQLQSLEGCPSSVGGYFDCSHNKLKNLEGLPDGITKLYADRKSFNSTFPNYKKKKKNETVTESYNNLKNISITDHLIDLL